jgi:hypothetical protein
MLTRASFSSLESWLAELVVGYLIGPLDSLIFNYTSGGFQSGRKCQAIGLLDEQMCELYYRRVSWRGELGQTMFQGVPG